MLLKMTNAGDMNEFALKVLNFLKSRMDSAEHHETRGALQNLTLLCSIIDYMSVRTNQVSLPSTIL